MCTRGVSPRTACKLTVASMLQAVSHLLPTAQCLGRICMPRNSTGFLCLNGLSPNKLITLTSAVKILFETLIEDQLRVNRG